MIHLYSSLMPYPIVISGRSVTTALAAAFMRSRALLSFGFSKPYLAHILEREWRQIYAFRVALRAHTL